MINVRKRNDSMRLIDGSLDMCHMVMAKARLEILSEVHGMQSFLREMNRVKFDHAKTSCHD